MCKILAPREVAKKIHVSDATFYRLKKTPDFPPAIKISERKSYYRESDIDHWLDSRKVNAAEVSHDSKH